MEQNKFNNTGSRPQQTGFSPSKPEDKVQKDSLGHKIGDAIEHLGEKITNAGAPKVGKVVYDAGNKIEHMGDKKGV